ncbi:HlyD family efflux transporter periplasmic adaptor subunit [[Phormidium] sp. ETS-05]|uniref:HlyD family efflux transporter periplasmic adaptor subunit n=1 Tax=[Phormidium] sp. ETS-05 TaxID=222819 RepID=UPI0018EEE1C2|nr:HlyD family efflux transporter periplasmic adaptor subunit [[Phormidium] sp. ETS-05]
MKDQTTAEQDTRLQDLSPMSRDAIRTEAMFDHPVILEPKPYWSSIVVWALMGMTAIGIVWAYFAKIEQVIPSTGKLEPQGAVVEVKAPTGGVVREILVKGGDKVEQGQIILRFDATAPAADVEALKQQRELAMVQKKALENQAYIQSLRQLRDRLRQETEAYQAEIDGYQVAGGGEFGANQQRRVEASRSEVDSRVQAARARVQELEEQLAGIRTQIPTVRRQVALSRDQLQASLNQVASARAQLPAAQAQLDAALAQLPTAEAQLYNAQQGLKLNESILAQISPLVEQGAVSELQRKRQEQEVLNRETEVSAREAEILSRRQEISGREAEILRRRDEITTREAELIRRQDEIVAREAEIERLQSQEQQLQQQINQAQQQLRNTSSSWQEELLTKIAENQKRLAEIEVQLANAVQENERSQLENQNRISQIDAQLARAQLQLQYQELKAPVRGYVFDLQPNKPGFVARETEPILKIVPDSEVEASVFISNQDIALVTEALRLNKERFANGEQDEDGVRVEVSVEAFPSTEYGTVEGVLTSIGDDALPPEQGVRPYWAFPATIKLKQQEFVLSDGRKASLKSGMAVQANINIGQQTVLEIFMGRLTRKTSTLETVR